MKACPGLRSGIDRSASLSFAIRGIPSPIRHPIRHSGEGRNPEGWGEGIVALGLVARPVRAASSPALHHPAPSHFHPLMRPSRGHRASRKGGNPGEVWRWSQFSYPGFAVAFPRATGMKIASESSPVEPITRRRGWRVALSGAAQPRSQFQREQQLIRRQLIHTRRNRIQDLRLSVAISRVDQKSALLKCLN